jgi:hypothetical protein
VVGCISARSEAETLHAVGLLARRRRLLLALAARLAHQLGQLGGAQLRLLRHLALLRLQAQRLPPRAL